MIFIKYVIFDPRDQVRKWPIIFYVLILEEDSNATIFTKWTQVYKVGRYMWSQRLLSSLEKNTRSMGISVVENNTQSRSIYFRKNIPSIFWVFFQNKYKFQVRLGKCTYTKKKRIIWNILKQIVIFHLYYLI